MKLININKVDIKFIFFICSLVFIAGLLFEAHFHVSKSLALFISSNNWNEIFTAMSGISSALALAFAIYVYRNWQETKNLHFFDDQAIGIKLNLLSWMTLKSFYKENTNESSEEKIALEVFKQMHILSEHITEEQHDSLVKLMQDLHELHENKDFQKSSREYEKEMSKRILCLISDIRQYLKK